jgi:hypothetical protein
MKHNSFKTSSLSHNDLRDEKRGPRKEAFEPGHDQNKLLLKEAIRFILLNEVKVGEIKKAMELVRNNKKKDAAVAAAKEAGKKGLKAGIGALIGLIPGGGTLWSAMESGSEIADVIMAASKEISPEEKKKNPIWDQLTIDPDTAAIVDDAVEANFLKDMQNAVNRAPDNQDIDLDIMLSNYLQRNYNRKHIRQG